MENIDENLPNSGQQPHIPVVPVPLVNELIITEDIKDYLRATSAWARFLAILGFVATALVIVVAAVMFYKRGTLMSHFDATSRFAFISMLVPFTYLIGSLIYFLISIFLYRFADHTKQAVLYTRQDDMLKAFRNLKSYFKTIGILAIVIMVFYLFAMVAAVSFFTMFQK